MTDKTVGHSAGGRGSTVVAALAVIALVLTAGGCFAARTRQQAASPPRTTTGARPDDRLVFERTTAPDRTLVRDGRGNQVASFTDGARTALITGAQRTFTEPAHTTVSIVTTDWIRLAPQVWHAGSEGESWFATWFAGARTDTRPDVLAIATEYTQQSPDRTDDKGIRYAGNASFGPVSETDPDGRAENSDFYDYLGISWQFPNGTVRPKPDRYGDVDCSGYLRLVYGYRLGYPLRNENTAGVGLPRRAFAISSVGPGVEPIANRGGPPQDYSRLQPGDLVFFHSDPGTPAARTDHSGIFIGVDNAGHYRFISSRSKADGPTFGDTGGGAVLDGGGFWSQRFRNARRL